MHDYEHYRRILEASGRYRVLERFVPRMHYHAPYEGETLRKAAFVDIETTGLNCKLDAVIELGVLLFSYTLSGEVVQVIAEYSGFDDPGVPIPSRVTQLTGITDEMVRGQRLDEGKVAQLLAEADLVLAHNAAFDRPFFERRLSGFDHKPWACSQHEVPWREHGLESTKLEFLTYRYGLFHNGHRALGDCRIALYLLARPLPGTGTPALAALLEAARTPSYRLWAVGSPYESKDLLKHRRYRWDGAARCWWIVVSADEREAEVAFLKEHVLAGREPRVEETTACARYREA